jgi:hypothetical protein
MKMRWLGLLLLSCHPKTTPVAEDAAPAPSASVAVVDAGLPPTPEKPLSWGTRPSERGPLFPVVDGLCGSATVRALEGKTIYYGETFARFEDDGLVLDEAFEKPAEKSKAEAWKQTTYVDVSGTWPRLVLFSGDRGGGRMRSFESIWVHEENGWSYFGSSEEKDEPSYKVPIQYRDWLITSRRGMQPGANTDGPTGSALIHAWPMKKDAPPIPGLASLGRKGFSTAWLAAAGDSLYAFGWNEGEAGFANIVRVLKDGKVSEGANPQSGSIVIGKKDDSLFVLGDDNVLRRFDGTKATALPFKPKNGAFITGAAVAPNGDIWAVTSKSEVMILHDGSVTASALPAPASKPSSTNAPTYPVNQRLAGVELGEPWAIGETGALYRFENEEWHEVAMPAPPFSTNGKYRAQSVTLAAKGDVYVSASYYEKGIGWKNSKTYNAVLRTRRPKETLRCNEAPKQLRIDRLEVGHGFFSAPPIADDTCTTPFVLIVRLGSKKEPNFLYDRGYPTLRTAIKETPGLGVTTEILEVPWGTVQAIGLKAPDLATAKALALNAAKRVKSEYQDTEPEIVCGIPPTIDKTMLVDVATGKFVTPDAN